MKLHNITKKNLLSGHATVGVQDRNTILKEVREFNEGKAPIFGMFVYIYYL